MTFATLRGQFSRWLCARSEVAYRTTANGSRPGLDIAAAAAPLTVLTFVGHAQVPQAVASLRSFLRFIGRPRRIIVGSDGTLGAEDEKTLSSIHPSVEVLQIELDRHDAHPELVAYARGELWGRKLLFIASANEHEELPLLYFDSDVLFFAAARSLCHTLSQYTVPAYMEEPNRGAFDERWDPGTESLANAGFLFLPTRLDWTRVLERHGWLLVAPGHRTEQTILNLALRDAGARALDPSAFVLDYRDARSPQDVASRGNVVARHYVAPIRWKFWISVAGGWTRALGSALSGRWIGQE
jgi:hypothetical protein